MNSSPLDALRDIHLPPTPDWWPPAVGWWIILVMSLAALAILGRRLYHVYRRGRRRRRGLRALAELCEALEKGGNPARFAGEVSLLLRRVALNRCPPESVAGLFGLDWLRFLDENGGQGGFVNGPGQVLRDAPYRRQAPVDVPALTALARDWLRRNC
ncbi:MAG: DUF4381 domain-containing protein [Gammaproteobacteria bacterium]|nr:DUF4381 domain-containing protein [Gammaproteobacteria bacterium]MCP5458538.1 DUF4381 domain-containing protein [Gammaproteobacteria bacterium]